MTSTAKILISAQDLPNGAAASPSNYTSPVGGKGTWIDSAHSVNHSGSTANVTVNVVPSGGSVAASNLAVSAQAIAAGAQYSYPELVGRFLAAGDTIEPFASAGTAINIVIAGRELT